MFDFDRIFNDFFKPGKMKINLTENENEYIASIELPGIKKEKIKVEYKNETLNIYVSNNEENILEKKDTTGIDLRSVAIPGVDYKNAEASYLEGLLTIKLPKKEIIDQSYLIPIK